MMPTTNSAVSPLELWFATAQTPKISVKKIEMIIKIKWKALSDMFD